MVAHTRKSGIRKKVYENDEMMDIFVAHAKFDGGYDFDRSSSEVECKLHDGYSSNDHKWNDARLYMKLVGVDHYVMGIDFNGNNFQTAEQLIDNGNGETIGDTMSELLSYAQFYGSSHERWSATKSKSFNSMVKQKRYSIKKSVQSELAEELVGYFGSLSDKGREWVDDNADELSDYMSEGDIYGIFTWCQDAVDCLYDEGYGSDADIFAEIDCLIQSHDGPEIQDILDIFRNAESWYDIYTELQDVE